MLGVRQVFLRLSGCNLACDYCDTTEARIKSDTFTIPDAEGNKQTLPNPIDVEETARLVGELWKPSMHSVSLTGGEPLLQAEELTALLPLLKQQGMPIYLETNGTRYEELKILLPHIDWIAMDIKLPSSQGGKDLFAEHVRFLEIAAIANIFLKMVITPESGEDELSKMCAFLSRESRSVTLVLQPATSADGSIALDRAIRLHGIASAYFNDVRVIPQMHRLWGIK